MMKAATAKKVLKEFFDRDEPVLWGDREAKAFVSLPVGPEIYDAWCAYDRHRDKHRLWNDGLTTKEYNALTPKERDAIDKKYGQGKYDPDYVDPHKKIKEWERQMIKELEQGAQSPSASPEPPEVPHRELTAPERHLVQDVAKVLRGKDDMSREARSEALERVRDAIKLGQVVGDWKSKKAIQEIAARFSAPVQPAVEPEPPEQPSEYRVQKTKKALVEMSKKKAKDAQGGGWSGAMSWDDFKSDAQRWNEDLTPEMKAAGLGDKRRRDGR